MKHVRFSSCLPASLLFLASLALSSCVGDSGKALKASEDFLGKSLVDPSSLKDLTLGQRDSLFEEFSETAEARQIRHKIDSLKPHTSGFYLSERYRREQREAIRQNNALVDEYKKKKAAYKGHVFKGWWQDVTFKASTVKGKEFDVKARLQLTADCDTVKRIYLEDSDCTSAFSIDYWSLIYSQEKKG